MRGWWVAFLLPIVAWGQQQPYYTTASIVNACNYSAGPFAPNSILSIFGTNLSYDTQTLTADLISGGRLPTLLAHVRVYVAHEWAPLFYVSPTQINFLMPSDQIAGDVPVQVVREGVYGPEVTVTLTDAAPQLFDMGNGYAVATHADNTLLTPDSPAHPNEVIVIYTTGMGATQPAIANGEIAPFAAWISQFKNLKVELNGVPADQSHIWYAGVSPGSAGLYQINLALTGNVAPDPQIEVIIGDHSSTAGLKIAVGN